MARPKNAEKGEFKTGAKQVETARKGGIASGEAKRRKKELRECLEMLLEKPIKARNGEVMTGADAISAKLFEQALKGNIKAFEVIRDTAGQKPIEKVMVSEIEQSTIDEVADIVKGKRNEFNNNKG